MTRNASICGLFITPTATARLTRQKDGHHASASAMTMFQ